MANNKSTLNSSMPSVTGSNAVMLCSSKMGSRKSVYDAPSSKVKVYCCLKQPSKKYNYQVQYKISYRNKEKGKWTSVSGVAWKCAVGLAKSGKLPAVAQGSTSDPNTWLRGNVSAGSTTWVHIFKSGFSFTIPDGYDAAKLYFRIRTIEVGTTVAKTKHGPWSSAQSVYVTKPLYDTITAVGMSRDVDGGLILFYDRYTGSNNADKSASVQVTDVTRITGQKVKSILSKALTTTPKLDVKSYNDDGTTTSNWRNRTVQSGVTPFALSIPLGYLKEPIGTDRLSNGNYSVDVKIAKGVSPYETCEPGIASNTQTASEYDGVVEKTLLEDGSIRIDIHRPQSGSYNIADVSCTASYVDHAGKTNKLEPAIARESVDSDDIIGTYTFSNIPANTNVETVSCVQADDYSLYVSKSVTRTDFGKAFVLKSASGAHMATLIHGVKISVSTKGKNTIESTLGRKNPFAVFTNSNETSITLSGLAANVDFGPEEYQPLREGQRIEKWEDVRDNQNEVYYLYTPKSEVFKVVLTGIDIESSVMDFADVKVGMTVIE